MQMPLVSCSLPVFEGLKYLAALLRTFNLYTELLFIAGGSCVSAEFMRGLVLIQSEGSEKSAPPLVALERLPRKSEVGG